jgi:NAD(P)-dependent dehydrogenase (short-subunit alcohol dehydrogenase family)
MHEKRDHLDPAGRIGKFIPSEGDFSSMKDDVVVITGANNGICLAMAEELAKTGYRVAGLDLSGENLEALVRSNPENSRFYRCDVTNPGVVEETIAAIVDEWKRVDVLVNGACIAFFAPFETKSLADTRKEFEVNYFGYLNMIKAVLPVMKAQGTGVIHNFSSGVGMTGFPGIYGYASTKGAIEALTRTLALELKPQGITVNLMHPPLTRTKSASPLGVPEQMMAAPTDVGKKLARKVGSKKPVLTPDFSTRMGLFPSRHFPEFMGRMFANMTARAKAGTTK